MLKPVKNYNDCKVKHVFVLAGEASGDAIGAGLIRAMKQQTNAIKFTGIAGEKMLAAGCVTLFPQSEISLMGLAEILPHIRQLKRRINQTVEAIIKARPNMVITIDAPGFNTRVAKSLRKHPDCPKLVHYVAPSVWAWKPKRADVFTELFDGLLCLLPFEPAYFPKLKKTYYVGHPVLESGADKGDGKNFRNKYNLSSPLIGMLPGSRLGEVNRLLPILRETAHLLPDNAKIVIPLVEHLATEERITAFENWPRPVNILTNSQEKYDMMAACDAAIAASGTVTLELAMAKVPTTVAYQLNPLTWHIAKRLVKLKYASLINILRDEMILPEYIQGDCTPENLANSCKQFLKQNSKATLYYHQEIQKTLKALKPHAEKQPSEIAADIILNKFML